MRKARYYSALIALVAVSASTAQNGLTMSTTGKSSLLFRGNTLGVNVTDANVEFSVNNLDRTIAQKRMPFYGLGARVGNSSSIGNIFNAGNFVAGATAEGYAGFTCSNGQAPSVAIDRIREVTKQASAKYYITMKAAAISVIQDPAFVDFRNQVLVVIDPVRTMDEVMAAIQALAVEPSKALKEAYVLRLLAVHQPMFDAYTEQFEFLMALVANSEATYTTGKPYRQTWFFGFGGIDGNTFKLVGSYDTLNVANSFTKQEYRGGYAGLGVNAQRGHWTFGFTYQYRQTNNLQDLTKVDYVIRTTRTTGNTAVIQEDKGTAYTGTYGLVEVNQLNVDMAYSLKLDSVALSHVLLSPYARFNLASRDTSLLKNTWNLGLGAYFVEKTGKFMGGLYVELPDVANTAEMSKPEAEQNLRPAEQRITFGIVAKVMIGSVLKLY